MRGARWTGWVILALLIVLLGWLGTGFYVVAADERAVVRQFGVVTAQIGPGMHYAPPWPVSRVDAVKATSVLKAGAGFRFAGQEAEALTGVELLTGDTNILSIALVLQFVIRDPSNFLTRIEQPRELVELLAQCALTEAVATMPVDEVLTTGRLAIQDRVRVRTQRVLDRERSGIQITSANIMAITLESIRNGWTPISIKRVIALGASFVCNVLKTKCPVKDACTAISAVSTSRISPTRIMFGA